jgi:hypothetical protein
MTPEERQMLASLFERVGSTASTPRDPQAETFIADAVRALPFAPYVLAQTVLVQQQALENASRRLAELEAQAKAAPQEETRAPRPRRRAPITMRAPISASRLTRRRRNSRATRPSRSRVHGARRRPRRPQGAASCRAR